MKTAADRSIQSRQGKSDATRPSQRSPTEGGLLESSEGAPRDSARPGSAPQRSLQETADDSSKIQQFARMRKAIDKSPRMAAQAKLRGAGGPRHVLQLNGAYAYGGGHAVTTTIDTQEDLDEAVEDVLEDRFEGYRGLFLSGGEASSPAQWAGLVLDGMTDKYTLDGLFQADVRTSIETIKDKYREEVLLYYAKTLIYEPGDQYPYSASNLGVLMAGKGIYIEHADDDVLEVIFDTEGEFARTKVEVEAGCLELSDEDNIVVIMDPHQNKHHSPQLPEFAVYTGGPGSRFAADKDLDWHRANTVPVVRETIETAIDNEDVEKDGEVYVPSKDAKDGIIYDLSIVYDSDTGKFVGSYHCNPVDDEQ